MLLNCRTHRVLFFGVVMFLNKESMDVPATTPLPPWQLKLFYVTPLLVTVNSATNVVIYASLSRRFREECRKVFSGLYRSGSDYKLSDPRPAEPVIESSSVV